MNPENLELLNKLYDKYNNKFRPLFIEVEITYQLIPLPIFNEIRAFSDHIARCYLENIPENIDKFQKEQIEKAKGHVTRAIFDCYKYINVKFFDKIKQLIKSTKHIELITINNGKFNAQFNEKYGECYKKQMEAKLIEANGIDHGKAIELYEDSYNISKDISKLISDTQPYFVTAKRKFIQRNILKIFGWLIGMIISGIISSYIFADWINNFKSSLHINLNQISQIITTNTNK